MGKEPQDVPSKGSHWNCNKGQLTTNNFPTDKVAEIAHFLTHQDLDLLAITEAGLHGTRSRTMRTKPMNIHTINNALKIPGYSIILPDSWQYHDTERIFLYAEIALPSLSTTPTPTPETFQ